MNWVWLAVLEVQKTETCLDLEVKAGSAAVGYTTQVAAVFNGTEKNRATVTWRDFWRTVCDLSVLRQKLGRSHFCSDS